MEEDRHLRLRRDDVVDGGGGGCDGGGGGGGAMSGTHRISTSFAFGSACGWRRG